MKRIFKQVWSIGNMEVLDKVVAPTFKQHQQPSFSQATKKNHDALAELEKQFVQWSMLSPRIEEEVAARINLLAELSKEARGVRERGGKALKRSVRIGG